MKQLQNESEKHCDLFQQYLLSGTRRSKTEIAVQNDYSKKQIYKIASKHTWDKRILHEEIKHRKKLTKLFEQDYKSAQTKRLQNLVELYSTIQNNMGEFSSYFSFYLPQKDVKNPDQHINRLDKVLKMMQRYEQLATKYEKGIEAFGICDLPQTQENYNDTASKTTSSHRQGSMLPCSCPQTIQQKDMLPCENPSNIHPNTPFSPLQAKDKQVASSISNNINDIANSGDDCDIEDLENIDEIDDLDDIELMTKALFTDMQELIDDIPTDDDIPKPNLSKLSPKLSNDLQRYFEE